MYTPRTRGITLIETLLYIALLSILMTGVFEASMLILKAQTGESVASRYSEASFVSAKLAWALADFEGVPVIGGSACAQTLSVRKTGYRDNPIIFERDVSTNSIYLREAERNAEPLTTSAVAATCLSFTSIAVAGGSPPGITAEVTIDGHVLSITRYAR